MLHGKKIAGKNISESGLALPKMFLRLLPFPYAVRAFVVSFAGTNAMQREKHDRVAEQQVQASECPVFGTPDDAQPPRLTSDRERAVALGWADARVLVIDDDLGQSGQSVHGRPGFQRLLAEVGLDHVGIVLGLEMSRLARSCRDWHQLLELCALFGTLLGDADGVYDPRVEAARPATRGSRAAAECRGFSRA